MSYKLLPDDRKNLHDLAIGLEWFTVIWNLLEAGVAVTAGIISGSVALIGFGIDSLIELLAGGALLWRFKSAGPNASTARQHLFESRALLVVGISFLLLAGYVVFDGIVHLITRTAPEESVVGLILAGASVLVMPGLAYVKQEVAIRLDSRALRADAIETWVCLYLSVALLLGVGLYWLVGWWWVDSMAALVMVPVIVWQGLEALEEGWEHRG